MTRLLGRSSRRFLLRHPWQYALAVAGVALGVAVVLGVDLAGASARRAFEASQEMVTGRATHQVLPLGTTLDERLYVRLRLELGLEAAAPALEGGIVLPGGRRATLLGVDPFSEAPFRADLAAGSGELDVAALLSQPGAVALAGTLARELGVSVGDALAIDGPAGERTLVVAGLLEPEPQRRAVLEGYVVADVSTAQEVLGALGGLSRIDLRLGDAQAARLADALPPDAELVEAAARSAASYEMTRAFRLNLTALSLLALLVGAFLIYSTLAFLVVRRTRTIGILRSLGVERSGIARSVLAEALWVGIPGTLAGLALGALLGSGLTSLVVRTIDDLYFRLRVDALALVPWPFAKAALLGIGATTVAALGPALEAAGIPPRAVLSRASMERRTRRRMPWQLAGAALSLLLAVALLAAGADSLLVSFAGLFAVFIAAALATTPATAGLMATLGRLLPQGAPLPLSMAIRGSAASLSRTGVAVSALSVAVATVIGVGLMVASFRGSVEHWLDRSLVADLYLYPDAGWCRAAGGVDSLAVALTALPGVAGVTFSQRRRLPAPGEEIRLWAVDPGPDGLRAEIVAGDGETAQARFAAGEAVLVSEPWVRRRGAGVGDVVTLPTPAGPRRFPVAGVFRDYSSDRGVVALHRDAYRALWNDACVEGMGVSLEPGADARAARAAIEARIPAGSGTRIAANAELRAASLAVFDRTFTITRVLQLLVGIVAFLGILSALQALQLERVRETAVLRAVGWLPRQLRALIAAQTSLLGFAAGLFAIPVGIALAGLLVFVINRRAFGWSMEFSLVPAELMQGMALALAAAFLASLGPAWRATRRPVAEDLRED